MLIRYKNNAESSLAVETTALDTTLTIYDVLKFPAAPFYLRIGTDEAHQVVKVISRSFEPDLFLLDAAIGSVYPIGTPVKITVCSELLDYFQQAIPISTAIHVGGDTPDYATLAEVVEVYGQELVAPTAGLEILLHGHFDETLSSADFADASRIVIRGDDVLGVTLTSVQSSSGSAGNRSIVLNLASVTGLSVGDIVQGYPENLSGGTNPEALIGAFKITDVDAVNDRITIHSTHWGSTAPSGAITGDLFIYTTVIAGLALSDFGFKEFSNIAITNGRTGTGVSLRGQRPSLSPGIMVVDCTTGIDVEAGSAYSFFGTVSNCGTGLIVNGGTINATFVIATGCEVGAVLSRNASFDGDMNILGCDEGLQVSQGATCHLTDLGEWAAVAIKDTVGTAIHASTYGYVLVETIVVSGNGTDYSPALNTQGNKFGYIDDGT